MDYHADRFEDHSLQFFDENGRLRAIFPACQNDGMLVSHGGLTYGGIVSGSDMTTPMMLDVFAALLDYAQRNRFEKIIYKTIPSIYARLPAEEDRYALFRYGAHLVRRDVLSVLQPLQTAPVQTRRKRKISQAKAAGLTVSESDAYELLWPILEENLAERHRARPVHDLSEIRLLAERFPGQIKLHLVKDGTGCILAGAVVYVTDQVAHVQYITTSRQGRDCGALDLMFAELIETTYQNKMYFDFGISNENNGLILNVGLIEQKEGFGARAIIHDYYELIVA
jgi:hypothetical protein